MTVFTGSKLLDRDALTGVDTKVKMRTSGIACITAVADDLTGRDGIASRNYR